MLLVLSFNFTEILKKEEITDIKRQLYSIISGLGLCIPFMLLFTESLFNRWKDIAYLIVILSTIGLTYLVSFAVANYRDLFVSLLNKITVNRIFYSFCGLLVLCLAVSYSASSMPEYRNSQLNIFYRYGVIIFVLSIIGNYLIVKRYLNIIWVVIFCCLSLFIYDIAYLLWIITRELTFWKIVKELYNRKAGYILPLILSTIPFIMHLFQNESKKESIIINSR